MAHVAKTFCRNCMALCSMELTIEDGRIISVAGDREASPYGGYICPKGHSSAEFHNGAEDRLLQSLKHCPDGAFAPIAADTAMDEIAAQLAALVDEHGPRSVALFHGTGAFRTVLGNAFEKSFLSALGTPNLFSTMTIDQSAKWVTMGRMGFMAAGKPFLADVDLGVIVGNNPVVSHQTYPFAPGHSGAPGRYYAEAKRRGMKLIVVDPRRTETARYADLLIQPIPGEDAALFAGVAHILLRNGTYNREFCDRFVGQLDALSRAVEPFTPDYVAKRCGVTVEQIEQAAKMLGEAKRPFVGGATGPSMSRHSNLNDHMIEAVNALVGGYARAGDLVRNPGVLKPRRLRERVIPANRTWERGVKCRSADIGTMFNEFPSALLPDEILQPGPDKIRALICFAGNPVMALGDPAKTLPAFHDLELLVVLDARMNETASLAHYVVATSQPFERHDVTVTGDAVYPEPYAQYAPPVLAKPPGVIDDWAFFWGVASRMRMPLIFKYVTYGMGFDATPGGIALDMETQPDPEDLIRHMCEQGSVSLDELKANPSGVRPKIAPQFVEPADDDGVRLEICPPDVEAEIAALLTETENAAFPYRLTSRRTLESMNSAFRAAPRTRERNPVNWAFMNPADMATEGVTDGDKVEIASEFGQIVGVAKAEAGLRPGVVSMTHMFGGLDPSRDPQAHGGSWTGRLISLERYLEPINFMPRFSGVPVRLRRLHNADT